MHLFYCKLRSTCNLVPGARPGTGDTEKDEKGFLPLRFSASRRDRKENHHYILTVYHKDESYEGGKRRALWVQKRAPDTVEGEVTPDLILR